MEEHYFFTAEKIVTEPAKPFPKPMDIDSIKEISLKRAVSKIVKAAQGHNQGTFWWLAERYADIGPVKELIQAELYRLFCDDYSYRVGDTTFELANGARIALRSGHRSDYLRGFALHGVVLSRWLGKDTTICAMTCLTQTRGWAVWVRD